MRFFVHLASYSYVTTASSEPRGRAMMNLLCITMIRRNDGQDDQDDDGMIRMTMIRMRRRWVL